MGKRKSTNVNKGIPREKQNNQKKQQQQQKIPQYFKTTPKLRPKKKPKQKTQQQHPTEDEKHGFKVAESELLPLLNASEERVRELSEYHKWINEVQLENQSLKFRHEAMMAELKGLRSFDATVMETDGQSVTFNNAVVIYEGHLNLIIKKYEKV